MEIRKASIKDLYKLEEIGKQTFIETFAAENSEENLNAYLETRFAPEELEKQLTDENAEFYFAALAGQTTGYLKVNFGPSQSDIKDDTALEVERLYVRKEFQGKNIGQMLLEKAGEMARRRNLNYIWLGVWEKNLRAIQFYKKNGFVPFDKHLFKLGNDEQTDIMMKLMLKE